MEKLFKEICLEEAKDFNEFWERSANKLKVLERDIAKEKGLQSSNDIIRTAIYYEIDKVLKIDGYHGDHSEVVEYFDRRHLPFACTNSYFEVQKKLQSLYYSLPKRTDKLERLQREKKELEETRDKFKHINEEILINTILKAFQEIIPNDINPGLSYSVTGWPIVRPMYSNFPWNCEVNERYIDVKLLDWYIRSINEYLATSMNNLTINSRNRLFRKF